MRRSSPGHGRDEQAARLTIGALSVTIAVAALAIATVHRATLLVVTALALASGYLALRLVNRELPGPRDSRERRRLARPSLVMLALAAITALQAMPFPARWVAVVAPANADTWQRALSPLDEPVRWASVSLDRGATLAEALKLCVFAAVTFAAAALAADRARRSWPVLAVFVSALLVAVVTTAHDLVGAERVFGIYAPVTPVVAHHLSPFLNPNNLAGYLNLGLFCGVGLALTREPPLPSWAAGIGVAVLIAVEVRSASRGAVLLLPVGLAMIAALTAWARFRHRIGRARQVGLVLGAAVLSGATLAVLGGTLGIWRELFQDNLSKLRFLPWSVPMVLDHKWAGIGRGTFESAFAAYRLAPGTNTVFTHPENFPLQWVAEWGMPVGAAALIALAWMLRPGAAGATRSGLAAGVWTAIVVLLAQNLADLGIEIAGVAVALAATLGASWGMRRRGAREERPSGNGSARRAPPAWMLEVAEPRWLGRGAAALAAVLVVALATQGLGGLRADREALRRAYDELDRDDTAGRARTWAAVRAAMLRHPADFYFPLVGAALAWRFRERPPMPWIQRALERAPLAGRTHLLLAEVLAGSGALPQALFELRIAAEHEPPLTNTTAQLAVRWARSFEDVMRAVPDGTVGDSVLDNIAARTKDANAARRADAELLRRDPHRVSARLRVAEAALLGAQRDDGAPPLCDSRETCANEVGKQSDLIHSARPESALPAMLRARLLVIRGAAAEAATLLAGACELPEMRALCLELRATVLAQLDGTAELDATLKAITGDRCGTTKGCAEAHTWVAMLRAQRGELALAVSSLRRAATEDPSEERWLRLAEMGDRAGRPSVVVEALERVIARRGSDPALKQRLETARRAAAAPHLAQ
jgi:hypothetical protein